MIPSWELLSKVFTVETIMTPYDQLLKWDGNEPLEALWRRAAHLKVDTIPFEQNGRMLGVLQRDSDTPVPLTAEWLISRDTAIPDIVQVFAEPEQPCLFVFYRQKVIGIVTPADLNKLPARTYFYNLLAELEMTIAEKIRRHYGDEQDTILTLLDRDDETDRIKSRIDKSDLSIDIVHLLTLSQLVNITRKSKILYQNKTLYQTLGFPSASQVEKHMNGLVYLRNEIMHANQLILDDYNGIEKLNEGIKRALEILNRMTASNNSIPIQYGEE